MSVADLLEEGLSGRPRRRVEYVGGGGVSLVARSDRSRPRVAYVGGGRSRAARRPRVEYVGGGSHVEFLSRCCDEGSSGGVDVLDSTMRFSREALDHHIEGLTARDQEPDPIPAVYETVRCEGFDHRVVSYDHPREGPIMLEGSSRDRLCERVDSHSRWLSALTITGAVGAVAKGVFLYHYFL